jgi:glycerol-3-phosphate O-acyltransferase
VPSAQAIKRAYTALLRWALRRVVRFRTMPESADKLAGDAAGPLCYVLHVRQLSALLTLEEATERLRLPPPRGPLAAGAAAENSSVLFLTRAGQPSPLRPNPYEYSPRLERLVSALRQDTASDVQLVPVSLFWGRAPEKQDSILRALFADAWVVPGTFRQLVRLLLHGRDTLVKFGEPIRLRAVLDAANAEGLDERTALRRVARLLRAEFRRERELAIGPNLSHRQTLLNEVIAAPAVQRAIAEEARQQNLGPEAAELAARRLAYRIASDYSYAFIRAYDLALSGLWNRIYDGVEVHGFDRVAAAGSGAEIVYVPCHRSHIDYLLLSYVIYRQGLTPPHIAAGDNLDLPLIGPILRRGGAFFLRRSFKGEPLYAAVFAEYLHGIVSRGFPIEYFVEGGRSRTGRMLAPKAGMLSMTLDSFLRGIKRPLVFVPVYVGYEQLLEGESYIAELSGRPKQKESWLDIVSGLRKLRRRRFGKVHVNFGEPLPLERFLDRAWPDWRSAAAAPDEPLHAAQRHDAVVRLAEEIVARISDALVVNPVNLIAVAMLGTPRRAMDAAHLAQQIDLLEQLLAAVPYSPQQVLTGLAGTAAVAYGEQLGILERIAHPLGDIVRVPARHAVLLGYFRNNVLHAYALPALIACLAAHNARIEPQRLLEIATRLYPFLRAELHLSLPPGELQARLQSTIDTFLAMHLVRERGLWLTAPAPAQRESLALHSLAQAMRQPLERYFIVVATLGRFGSGTLSATLLEDCCVLLAQRLAYLHEGAGPEFFDRASFRAIIRTLREIDLAQEQDGLLRLSPQLERSADDAAWLLSHETRLAISHITQLAEDDIVRAAAAANGGKG